MTFGLLLVGLLVCAGPQPLSAAKVRLPRTAAAARSGLEYETFRVVETDDATAAELALSAGGEVLAEADRIFLNAETLETTSAAVQALRRRVDGFAGRRLHLVQFAGPIQQAWVDALAADGLRIVTYLPSHAYLVWGDAPALARMQARAAQPRSAIQWEAAWQDRWKLAPNASAAADRHAASLLSVQLVADKEANEATLTALRAAGGYFLREPWSFGSYLNFVVQLEPARHGVLLGRPEVVSVHRYVEPKLRDESQSMLLAGNLSGNGPATGNYLTQLATWGFTQAQFDASGLVVDVSDDGVDNGTTTPNHFALYRSGDKTLASRLVYRTTFGTPGTDLGQGRGGHGQLNSSIVGGFVPNTSVTVNGNTTSTTTFPHADAQGFRYGLGVAPFVRLGNSTIFDPAFTGPAIDTLQAAAYATGARISSNSWGSTVFGTYPAESQAYDALVRDAASGTPGNQPMIIVFAAGNAGPTGSSITTPGTAKNIITVGAAEGVRSHATAAGGLDSAGTDGCGAPDAGANSTQDVAAFSSRGPCADGRVKPDVLAGGTHITGITYVVAGSTLNGTADPTYRANAVCGLVGNTSATGQLADFFPTANAGAPPYNQAQQWWTTSSGTSHSTPAVSGAAALVYQQFLNDPAYLGAAREPAGAIPPSPALTKAYLINSTRYLTGLSANDRLPSNAQGMGHVNLGRAFDTVPRIVRDQAPADRFTASGQSRTFSAVVADTSKPLRITLVWTDKEGPTAGNAYVNDLDLTVQRSGVTYRGNVFAATGGTSVSGGTADPRNNVESVFLPAGTGGAFTVTVTAANVAAAADPTVAGNNQDFALVIYNALPAVAVAAGAPVVQGSPELRPNDLQSLQIPLQNVGSVAATAVSAVLASSTPGVTVLQGSSAYPDLLVGGGGSNTTAFALATAADLSCGTVANLTLTVTFTGNGSPTVIPLSVVIGAPTATPYRFSTRSGASLPPGGSLVAGSSADEAIVTVAAPFAFQVYEQSITPGGSVLLGTNGTIQFPGGTGGSVGANTTLPAAAFAGSPTLFPFWDDLDLRAVGSVDGGIYQRVDGLEPNRQWTLEWRGQRLGEDGSARTVHFGVVFFESTSRLEFHYLQPGAGAGLNGSSATVGVQAAATGSRFSTFSSNAPALSPGLVVTATLESCASGTANGIAPAFTSALPPLVVQLGVPYSHTFTTLGSPAPTFTLIGGTLPSGLTLSPSGVLSGRQDFFELLDYRELQVRASNGITPDSIQRFALTERGTSLNSAGFTVAGGGSLRPNDCRAVNFMISNLGNLAATGVTAVLRTDTPGVTVTQPNSAYPDIAESGGMGTNLTPFQVSVAADVPCETLVVFQLEISQPGVVVPVVVSAEATVGPAGFSVTTSTGASIPAGGSLVDAPLDDFASPVFSPFAFTLLGEEIVGGQVLSVTSNGTLQSIDPQIAVRSGANVPLADGVFFWRTLCPYWDDLAISPGAVTGGGIYQQVVGAAPNREWILEWRGKTKLEAGTTPTLHFAIVLKENSSAIEYRYVLTGTGPSLNGSGASVGFGAQPFSYNAPTLVPGLRVLGSFAGCAEGIGPGPCAIAPQFTSAAPTGPVVVGLPFSHTFTASGQPAPTFTLTAGTLPPGLTLSPTGLLSGTATSAGPGSFDGLVVTASNGGIPNATQSFTLTVVTRADLYLAGFGLSGPDALPLADPNLDGVPNLLAYALGFSPVANHGAYERGVVRDYGGTRYLSLRFSRSSVATDLTYIVEATDDLTGAPIVWTELARSTAGGPMVASGGVVVSDAGGPPTYVAEVRDTVPVPAVPLRPHRFLRLRVTSP